MVNTPTHGERTFSPSCTHTSSFNGSILLQRIRNSSLIYLLISSQYSSDRCHNFIERIDTIRYISQMLNVCLGRLPSMQLFEAPHMASVCSQHFPLHFRVSSAQLILILIKGNGTLFQNYVQVCSYFIVCLLCFQSVYSTCPAFQIVVQCAYMIVEFDFSSCFQLLFLEGEKHFLPVKLVKIILISILLQSIKIEGLS